MPQPYRLIGQTDEDQPYESLWPVVKSTLKVAAVAIIGAVVVLFIVLLAVAAVYGTHQDNEHAKRQAQECRDVGGFARTDSLGRLEECTFPGSRIRPGLER